MALTKVDAQLLNGAVNADSSGNVGIGTTSPRNAGAGYKGLTLDASTSGFLDLNTNGTRIFTMYGGGNDLTMVNPTAAGVLAFGTNSTERMRIDSSGRLLVGKVDSVGAGVGSIEIKNQSGALYTTIDVWNTATSGNNIFETFATEGTYTARGSIDYNRAGGAVRYNTTSDERLKENIVDAPSALNLLDSVKIRSFDWKETGFHVEHGVIAQELETVVSDAVSIGEDNEDGSIKRPWGVDTSVLVPALIKAIQELKAEIDATKAEVASLKAGA